MAYFLPIKSAMSPAMMAPKNVPAYSISAYIEIAVKIFSCARTCRENESDQRGVGRRENKVGCVRNGWVWFASEGMYYGSQHLNVIALWEETSH